MGRIRDRVRAHARRDPERAALIVAHDGRTIGYGELDARVDRCRDRLRASRPADDGAILLIADDAPETVVLMLACNALGLTLAPLDRAIGADALAVAIERLGATLIVHDTADDATRAGDALPAALARLVEADGPACVSLHALAPIEDGGPYEPIPGGTDAAPRLDPIGRDHPFLLTSSSGSTGDPKPVIFTDRGKFRRALHTAAAFGIGQDDTLINASPFHHSLGQRLTIMPLVLGASVVMLRPFAPGAWLDAVRRHGVSMTICVSSHLAALQTALTDATVPIGRLRALVSSSANIDVEVKRRLAEQTRFDFFEMYGASEVATVTVLAPAQARAQASSVGRACRRVAVRIVGPGDRVLAPGEVGEIQVRSPLASPGYFARPELSRAGFADGWFRTGDLGRLDERGFLTFVDRRSDVVVTGGANVFPSDVESVARTVAGVRDCVVLGVPDAYLGDALIGVVETDVADDPTQLQALQRRLRETARRQLTPTQRPLAWYCTARLPLGASGKLDRRGLRESYRALGLDLSAGFRSRRTAA